MGRPPEDPLALLLPDASADRRESAQRLVTALRIFASDALDSGSSSVHVQLARAQEELEGHRWIEVRAALRDVLLHVAARCVPSSCFRAIGTPEVDHTTAWARLFDRLGDGLRSALGVELLPPGATARAQLESLTGALERLGERTDHTIDRLEASLWRGRLLAVDGRQEAATVALEAVLASHRAPATRPPDRSERRCVREAAAELAALALDVGSVDRAVDACARVGPTASRASECEDALDALALAARWASGASGDARFPDLASVFSRAVGDVPEAWAQLARVVWPGGSHEPGAAAPLDPAARSATGGGVERHALGAQAVVVLLVDSDGRTRTIADDVAPGLRHSVEAWASRRRDAIGSRGTLEHDAVRTGVPHALVRCRERPRDAVVIDRVCIDSGVAPPAALAAIPVLDAEAEVVGLVWAELTHRLLPTAARCGRVARAASDRLAGVDEARAPIQISDRAARPPRPGARARIDDARNELAAAWADAVRGLGLKTAERRWVAFQATAEEGGALVAAAQGGGGLELGPPSEAGAWAVRRAQRTGGHVRYAEDDAPRRPMMHPGAASGAALALRAGGSVRAVLVVESIRRGDARERDVSRWYEQLQGSADRLEIAMLHAVDRERCDGGFVVDCEAPDARRRIERLRAVARTRGDVLVLGEEGSGRRTTARWVAHRRSGPAGPCALSAFGLESDRLEAALAGGGAVVLADVHSLAPPAQASLSRWLDRPLGERPSLVVTATSSRADDAARTSALAGRRLHPDLVARLDRVVVRTSSLRESRHGIPALVRFLVRRFCASVAPAVSGEQRRPAPEVDDAAMGLFWRQPWPGNVAQLDGVVHAAVLASGGVSIDARAAAAALVQRGVDPVQRIASRGPDPRDVASAAWATRTASGRINKTRAALYLG
ncbi:MAG: hypothetical protein AAGB93_24390, partial [Planctomycetota bacterium]